MHPHRTRRRRRTPLVFLTVLCALLVAGGVSLETVQAAPAASPLAQQRQCDSHEGLADWSRDAGNPLRIRQFDPALGHLESVSVERTIVDRASMGSENVNPVSGATITFRARSSVWVSVPGVAVSLAISRDSGDVVNQVGPYDGTTDYLGTSGRTFVQPPMQRGDVTAVSDVTAYEGTGTVNALAGADADNSNTISNGNGDAFVRTVDRVEVCAVYSYRTSSVGDCVWNDLDHDGVQDAGEPGVPGVTVTVRDAATGHVVAVTTTAADGCYRVAQLACTTYRVSFSGLGDGWIVSPTNATTPDRDSNGLTSTTDLGACGDDMTVDLGVYRAAAPQAVALGAAGAPSPALAVLKQVRTPAPAIGAGATVAYRITVANRSAVAVAGVRLCDALPAHTTFVRAAGVTFDHGRPCWSIGTLGAHQSRVYSIVLRIDAAAAKGMRIRNCAIASATDAATVRGCRKVTVRSAVAAAVRGPAVTGRRR